MCLSLPPSLPPLLPSFLPSSLAITGEGVCDLLLLLAKLTQERMSTALM
jgi:hypothetical protein